MGSAAAIPSALFLFDSKLRGIKRTLCHVTATACRNFLRPDVADQARKYLPAGFWMGYKISKGIKLSKSCALPVTAASSAQRVRHTKSCPRWSKH
jgi:hypothetical protein